MNIRVTALFGLAILAGPPHFTRVTQAAEDKSVPPKHRSESNIPPLVADVHLIQDLAHLNALFGKDSGFAKSVDFSRKTIVAVIPRPESPQPMFHLAGTEIVDGKLHINCKVMPRCEPPAQRIAYFKRGSAKLNSAPLRHKWDGPQALIVEKTAMAYELISIPTRWSEADDSPDGCPKNRPEDYSGVRTNNMCRRLFK